jgi:hypothetical protein
LTPLPDRIRLADWAFKRQLGVFNASAAHAELSEIIMEINDLRWSEFTAAKKRKSRKTGLGPRRGSRLDSSLFTAHS